MRSSVDQFGSDNENTSFVSTYSIGGSSVEVMQHGSGNMNNSTVNTGPTGGNSVAVNQH